MARAFGPAVGAHVHVALQSGLMTDLLTGRVRVTGKRVRRGMFVSVEDLEKAIEEFLTVWNNDPKPFVWTATVESILEKPSRCRQTLERIKPGCTRPRMRETKG